MLDHVSPATRLLEKRRQMFEVQEALEAQKQEFNRKVRGPGGRGLGRRGEVHMAFTDGNRVCAPASALRRRRCLSGERRR